MVGDGEVMRMGMWLMVVEVAWRDELCLRDYNVEEWSFFLAEAGEADADYHFVFEG